MRGLAALRALALAALGACTARGPAFPSFDAGVPDLPFDDFTPAAPRWVACPDGRFDLANDNLRCGSCNHACNPSLRCANGVCAARPPCPAGSLRCGASCVDLRTDSRHCGGCDRACPTDATCMGAACRCADTRLTVCRGACVDLRANPTHCGACERTCNGACNAGACTCSGALTLCNGVCHDTRTSPMHCGRCNAPCPSGDCVAGRCNCPGEAMEYCAPSCVDLRVTLAHCGRCNRACTPTDDCVRAECVPRPWWPPFGARVATRTPTLRWRGAAMTAELCADRACERVLQRVPGTAAFRATLSPLEPGVYFWRLAAGDGAAASATSMFRVDARNATAPGWLPPFVDLNGDGFADLPVVSGRPGLLSVFLGSSEGLARSAAATAPLGEFVEEALLRAVSDTNADAAGELAVSFLTTSQLVEGARSLPTSLRTRTLLGGGPSFPALDLNGDGFDDWISLQASGPQLILMGRNAAAAMGQRAIAHPRGALAMTAAASLGDVDGDEYPDVALGAPMARPRRVYVYFGSSVGLDRAAPLVAPPHRRGLQRRAALRRGPQRRRTRGHHRGRRLTRRRDLPRREPCAFARAHARRPR